MENIPGGEGYYSSFFEPVTRHWTQVLSFQSLPHSLPRKNTRRGGRVQKRRRPSRSDGGICGKGVPSSGEKIVDRFTVAKNVARLTVTKNIEPSYGRQECCCGSVFRWRRRRRYIRQEFPPMPLLDGVVRGHREQRRRRFRPL